MWSVPDVKIGSTQYSDDAAGAWWQSTVNNASEFAGSGACETFFGHLPDFGWTPEQGKDFQLKIDMRTLVLATAVNDGVISLDPETVTQSMLPLSKKFYSGPDLEDDLFAGEADASTDDLNMAMFDDDFFFFGDDASYGGGGFIFGNDYGAGYGAGGYYSPFGYYDYGGYYWGASSARPDLCAPCSAPFRREGTPELTLAASPRPHSQTTTTT